MSKELRIIFLGTPDFAVASLQKLAENNINVVAVVTAPDKPKGRGKKLGSSAVKDYALEIGLPILQPTNLKSVDFLEELKSYQADLQIVVAFRMLPEAVWRMPPLGTFNLHASLLPQYRGAAPINWAIINGERETGVTTFFLKHEIDTGEIIFREREAIMPKDTAGSLYARLMEKGAHLVLKTVAAIQENEYPQSPQQTKGILEKAPKIFKNDCKIYWNQASGNIINFIRGLSPLPGAWSIIDEKMIKVFEAEETHLKLASEIGVFVNQENRLLVKTQDAVLKITDLQLEGKQRMRTEDFLKGYRVN
ncbi:MAG: methionyl-tRNA formyltransferase [Ekhidna sp.]|nr:methionyl-tRNA formyltransferase [Ekhidna sp.]